MKAAVVGAVVARSWAYTVTVMLTAATAATKSKRLAIRVENRLVRAWVVEAASHEGRPLRTPAADAHTPSECRIYLKRAVGY
jgi:hypothetical protein